jgi:exosortase H (IPTLxxWG-CTERM-specific)
MAETRSRIEKQEATSGRSRGSMALRFCTAFLLLVAFYAGVFTTPFVERFVHAPLSRIVAWSSWALLSPFGDATIQGTHIAFNGFRAVIVEACNGVLPTYLYLAAVVAFPSGWREKLWGGLIGIPLIYAVNVVRVISLMILGAARPDVVELVHIHVWQALLVASAMGIWIFWTERFVRPQLALRR